MSMIRIYDNFIPEINLKPLSDILTFKMPWYFSVDGKFNTSIKQSLSLGCVKNKEEFGSCGCSSRPAPTHPAPHPIGPSGPGPPAARALPRARALVGARGGHPMGGICSRYFWDFGANCFF